MRLGEHLDDRNAMKKKGQAAQVNADTAPTGAALKNGGKRGDTGTRVQENRRSQPK